MASPQARSIIEKAFNDFEQSVRVEDRREFQSSTLEQVRNAIREVERSLAARQCLRNTRRLVPFLEGLDRYSKPLEVLCNGTPYLPWIWAPVKLMVQIASEHINAFEKLLGAYARIADALPRFDRLSKALKDDANFQQVLALFYADILEFHKAAYKFFRRSGWKCFFRSTWGRFDLRFDGIIESLSRHTDLVDKEASAVDIAESKEWRNRQAIEIEKQETRQHELLYQAAIAWLEVKDTAQEDEQERLLQKCHSGSFDWMTRNEKLKPWLRRGPDSPFLWIYGKPGSGKSVLASTIVNFLRQDSHTAVLFFYFTDSNKTSANCAQLLRTLAAQLLRLNPELSSHVVDDFKSRGLPATVSQLKKLLPSLLGTIPSVRIVVDGLDELTPNDQKQIINEILLLVSSNAASGICKVILTCRELPHISRMLARRPRLSLTEEGDALRVAIRNFVHERLESLRDSLEDLSISPETMAKVESQLVDKADGMFLWVQLVLSTIEDVYSIEQLEMAVDSLPRGLFEMYDRIIKDVQDQSSDEGKEIVQCTLNWIACASRPIKGYELLCGLALHPRNREINDQKKVSRQALDLCKPLVENGPNDSLIFIHFSVKEYLLQRSASPRLELTTANAMIALACILNLSASVLLVHPEVDERQRYLVVSKGYLGLVPYAENYLEEHMTCIADSRDWNKSPDSTTILDESKRLFGKHEYVQGKLRHNAQWTEHAEMPMIPSTHSLLKLFDGDPDLQSFFQRLVLFREMSRKSKPENGADSEKSDILRDPTLFSSIRKKYNEILHNLSTGNSKEALSLEELRRFRELYGRVSIFCRFKGCPRSSDGFIDDSDRGLHEDSHKTLHYCHVTTCSYSVVGVMTLRSLRKHIKNFHEEDKAMVIQAKVPRRISSSDANAMDNANNGSPIYPMTRDAHSDGGWLTYPEDFTGQGVPQYAPTTSDPNNLTLPSSRKRKKSTHEPRRDRSSINRNVTNPGTEVFYSCLKGDVKGVLCDVVESFGDGELQRYLLNERSTSRDTPSPFWASSKSCIPIPSSNEGLRNVNSGALVCGKHPSENNFYFAIVSLRDDEFLTLSIDGERHDERVERRYVLSMEDVQRAEAG